MSEGSVFLRADGKWCAKWKDATGKWRYLYRKSKGEAKKALRAALKDRDGGIIPPPIMVMPSNSRSMHHSITPTALLLPVAILTDYTHGFTHGFCMRRIVREAAAYNWTLYLGLYRKLFRYILHIMLLLA